MRLSDVASHVDAAALSTWLLRATTSWASNRFCVAASAAAQCSTPSLRTAHQAMAQTCAATDSLRDKGENSSTLLVNDLDHCCIRRCQAWRSERRPVPAGRTSRHGVVACRDASAIAGNQQWPWRRFAAITRRHAQKKKVNPATSFSDRVRITVQGGRGGRGCASFGAPSRGRKRGAPNGMSGGNGGNVLLVATQDLEGFAFSRFHIAGEPGAMGAPERKPRNGEDVCVPVPVGTLVFAEIEQREPDPDSAEEEQQRDGNGSLLAHGTETEDMWHGSAKQTCLESQGDEDAPVIHTTGINAAAGKSPAPDKRLHLVADLCQPGSSVCVARGGHGGLGNISFRNSDSKFSTFSTAGELPGRLSFLLELRTIADVGLVGLPNAGKSSLLRALSAAKPQVAPYPFTTLRPHVGVVDVDNKELDRYTVADIPGLVKGAHLNAGLGHHFLKHVARTKALVYVVDISPQAPVPACEALEALRLELGQYDQALLQRPALVFANKVDLIEAPADGSTESAKFLETMASIGEEVVRWSDDSMYVGTCVRLVSGSALHGHGVAEAAQAIYDVMVREEK